MGWVGDGEGAPTPPQTNERVCEESRSRTAWGAKTHDCMLSIARVVIVYCDVELAQGQQRRVVTLAEKVNSEARSLASTQRPPKQPAAQEKKKRDRKKRSLPKCTLLSLTYLPNAETRKKKNSTPSSI